MDPPVFRCPGFGGSEFHLCPRCGGRGSFQQNVDSDTHITLQCIQCDNRGQRVRSARDSAKTVWEYGLEHFEAMVEGQIGGLMVTVGRKVDCQEPGIVVTLTGPEGLVSENFSKELKAYVEGLLERTAQPDI